MVQSFSNLVSSRTFSPFVHITEPHSNNTWCGVSSFLGRICKFFIFYSDSYNVFPEFTLSVSVYLYVVLGILSTFFSGLLQSVLVSSQSFSTQWVIYSPRTERRTPHADNQLERHGPFYQQIELIWSFRPVRPCFCKAKYNAFP